MTDLTALDGSYPHLAVFQNSIHFKCAMMGTVAVVEVLRDNRFFLWEVTEDGPQLLSVTMKSILKPFRPMGAILAAHG